MFYSHQLLARKVPLGQIWMAATMHAKINRKKLSKLNIIKICEEILNPSVPMALRLSGILMGGVVIVYERKVKLLYDDVNRFLVEINSAWKVKPVSDPTLLPKGKSQAKYEAVTLTDNQDVELTEIDQSLNCSKTMMGFQETAYFEMRLDRVDELYINNDPREEAQSEHYHQADADNITLFDRFDSCQTDVNIHSRFERFDVEGDDETQANFTSQERTQIPSSLIPSPPLTSEPQKPDEILDQHPEDQVYHRTDEVKAASQPQQDLQRQGPTRRKARKPAAFAMDYEQTIIPGHIYQSWLQSASDIVSRRGRKRKHFNAMSTMKIGNLMDLPPTVLLSGLFTPGNREVHYPAPLLELWVRSTQPPHDSPSGKTSPPQPPEASASSPADRVGYKDSMGFPHEPHEGVHGGLGSPFSGRPSPTEKPRTIVNKTPTDQDLVEELGNNPSNNGVRVNEANVLVTPGDSGDERRSIPSAGSGHGFQSDATSGRSNKKRPHSSSRHSGSGLEPVAEENACHHPEPSYKLARLSENGLTPEDDLLVETGPTQTQQPILNPPVDQITNSIGMQLKIHFETPGSSRKESLNQLASGMNKTRAAHLFYQTCVLATRDFLRVEQHEPYGEILISRGAKM